MSHDNLVALGETMCVHENKFYFLCDTSTVKMAHVNNDVPFSEQGCHVSL